MKTQKYKGYIFCINFLICLFAMKTFIFGKYFSVDDYSIFYNQSVSLALADMSAHMRIVSNSILALLSILKVNIVEEQKVFGMILLVAFAWAATKISLELFNILYSENDGKDKNFFWIICGTMLLFVNAFMSENLYFSGVYIQWIISVPAMAYASVHIGKTEEILKNWIIGVFALFIALGSYQLFIAQYAYVVMAIIFIRNKARICKESSLAVLRAVAAPAAALGLQMICIRILAALGLIMETTSLGIQMSQIPSVIYQIIQAQKMIWVDGMGMYPKYVLVLALAIILGTLAVLMYKKKVGLKEIVFVVLVLVSGQFATYMPEIVQGSAAWMPPRILFPIFGIYTVGLYLIYYYADNNVAVNIWLRKIGGFCIIIFLIYSSIKLDEVAVDKAKVNTATQVYVDEIMNRINKYEMKNGVAVTKVGFCYDASLGSIRYWKLLSSEASWRGNINENPFVRSWSASTSLIYHSGRNFDLVKVPDSVEQYYSSLNWDAVDWDEQLFFDNDAVYICVY